MNVLRKLSTRTGVDPMVLLGLATVTVVFGLSALVFGGVFSRLTAESGTEVKAQFATTSRLQKGSPVRVNGVTIGTVKRLALDPGGRTSTVTMDVYDEAMPVYRDATVFIRWRTALGGNYAVDLNRGTAASGELAGGTIPASATKTQVEVDQLTGSIQKPQRRGLQRTLNEVPKAMRNPAQPAGALASVDRGAPSLSRGIRALRGDAPGDLKRLVKDASRAVDALDDPTIPLQRLVEGAGRTLSVTAARQDDLRGAISRGAAIQPAVRETLTRLDKTLTGADPLVEELRTAAPDVEPAFRKLRPVAEDADTLLRSARPLLKSLPAASRSLATASDEGAPLLRDLQLSVDRLDKVILPGLAVDDPDTGVPTYQAVGPALSGLSGGAPSFDAAGRYFRFPATIGERPLDTLPCKTFLTDPTSDQLVKCDTLGALFGQVFGVSTRKK